MSKPCTRFYLTSKGKSIPYMKYQNEDFKLLYAELRAVKEEHPIWKNPLLVACEKKLLSVYDFKYLFSQYYCYLKNFIKFIAIEMTKYESNYYTSKLLENIWKESVNIDTENYPVKNFEKFLAESLNTQVQKIKPASYTKHFLNQYYFLCLTSDPAECAAILSFGTQSLASRLYKIFQDGLIAAGLSDSEVNLFSKHATAGDNQALTLENTALAYRNEPNFLERCKLAITKALNIRNQFFLDIYKSLQYNKLESLVCNITLSLSPLRINLQPEKLIYQLSNSHKPVALNEEINNTVNLSVNRIPFQTEVLDSTVIHIGAGLKNELMRHPHETILVLISGSGQLRIDNTRISISTGTIIHIPRWSQYQLCNTSNEDLCLLSITDYGLTNRFPNTPEQKRKKTN